MERRLDRVEITSAVTCTHVKPRLKQTCASSRIIPGWSPATVDSSPFDLSPRSRAAPAKPSGAGEAERRRAPAAAVKILEKRKNRKVLE